MGFRARAIGTKFPGGDVMPRGKPPENEVGAPGLAGGPGPSPPGVNDGTPHPSLGATPEPTQSAEEQGDEARIAERTAGTRRDEIPARREHGGDTGERPAGDPDSSARREPGVVERGARGGRGNHRRARRGGEGPEE